MGTVTISAVNYTVYGSLTGATEYLNATSHANAIWAAASSDNRARALVTATRFLDRQRWAGAKAVDGQDLAWPRSGVVYVDGTEVDDSAIPVEVDAACYELAALMLSDAAAAQASGSGSKVQSASAGPASVSFFGPTAPKALPSDIVAQLVGQFLAGGGANIASSDYLGGGDVYVGGTSAESQFDDCDIYGLRG